MPNRIFRKYCNRALDTSGQVPIPFHFPCKMLPQFGRICAMLAQPAKAQGIMALGQALVL